MICYKFTEQRRKKKKAFFKFLGHQHQYDFNNSILKSFQDAKSLSVNSTTTREQIQDILIDMEIKIRKGNKLILMADIRKQMGRPK